MDNLDPLHLYSSLIFKAFLYLFGGGCCDLKLSSEATCILCTLIYPQASLKERTILFFLLFLIVEFM